ncbi:MAG: penicillin acylase family protein [Porphyrobacter sp.]|nr:penicillin acylase family protein [Porphyrobacter sp.]
MALSAMAMAALLVASAGAAQAGKRYEASITRTTYGIPHITAKTWQGVGYGVAYAYAEDNLCMLAEEFATVAGTRSQHFGPQGKAVLGFQEVDNLSSDVFFRAMIDLPALRAGASTMSSAAQALAEGYVAGYNRFLKDAGADGIPAECRGKAWVRPITLDDMLRLTEKQMLLASSLSLAPGIANAAPPGKALARAEVVQALPNPGELGFGSNGWAFGGDATADGRGLVIGNPHFPWNGPSRFWQMHVTGPDGYDVMGVGIAGTPIPTLGFNKDIAWTHTVTAARHFTLYALSLDPADPTRYMVDGQSMAMEPVTVSVPMPDGQPDITRTLYTTRFGAVFVAPQSGVSWNASTAYAIRDANRANMRAIDTWMAIGKARSVGEIKTAVSTTLGIPWVNTIASDRHGDALHADVTAVPNVSADKAKACGTPLSSLFARLAVLLDGSRSQCQWDAAPGTPEPGLMPASDQAATIVRDYLTNSNDSYWLSNPRLPHPALSPVLGKHASELTLRTRSNFIETEAMLAAGKVDHARAKALAFANKSLAADMTIGAVLALCEGGGAGTSDGNVARGCAALAGWDRRYEATSKGAALFREFWAKAGTMPGLWAVPFDPADPVNTPRDLAADKQGAKLLTALGEAVGALDQAGIALDAAWGDVQQWPDGDDRIPIHGGPGTAGVLNYQDARPVPGGGLVPVHGTSYIQIVGFDHKGPVADAILSYSQSTNPASPHYADQTRAYAAKKWHRLPFHRRDVARQRIGETRQIAE